MLKTHELAEARAIVSRTLKLYNNDRDKTIEHIQDLCRNDLALQVLFAKVGAEIYGSSNATKH